MLKFVIEMSSRRVHKNLILNATHTYPHFIGLCKIVFAVAKRSFFISILVSWRCSSGCYFVQVSGDVNSAGKIVSFYRP